MSPRARAVVRIATGIVLAGFGVLGLANALDDSASARTVLQHSVTAGSLLYGVLGILAGAALIRRRAWSVRLAIAWGIAAGYTAVTATIAYGELDNPWGPVLGSAAGSAALAALVIWGAVAGLRSGGG